MAKRKDLIMCTCPCHNEDEHCEQCCDGVVGRRAIATEGALLHLRNEIHGSLEISDRKEIARQIGWTNLRCLERRIEEADQVLKERGVPIR